ncbi:MAG: hypothetical protein JSS83_27710 [Cyanobacteria bacterium SZAS LIN-3]|nr:hypothetical protein [Cyanobacteria bacterium SZAS LIN-3]
MRGLNSQILSKQIAGLKKAPTQIGQSTELGIALPGRLILEKTSPGYGIEKFNGAFYQPYLPINILLCQGLFH